MKILGIILCILSVFIGLYVGGWLLFIGGIVQVVESIKMTPINSFGIAIGILRTFCSGAVGVLSFYLSFIVGLKLWMGGYR